MRHGVRHIKRYIVPDLAPHRPYLRERDPPGKRQHLIHDPGRPYRRIEEAGTFVRSISQRTRPVVSSGQIEDQALLIPDLGRREHRLHLPAGVYLLVDISRTVHVDIGDIEDIRIL